MSNSYRQNYKRKWIAACRLLKAGSNPKQQQDTLPEIQTVPVHPSTTNTSVCFESELEIDRASNNSSECHSPHAQNMSGSSEMSEQSSESDSNESSYLLDNSDETSLEDRLVNWVNTFNVKHNAVDSLLKFLKGTGHPNLPSTARSLLSTTRVVDTQVKSGMQYLHYPLEDILLRNFLSYPPSARENVEILELALNIDGIPLFKSSRSSLWPVLCGIMNIDPVKVFPVTLTYGKSKPADLEFLNDIVEDLNLLMNSGLKVIL